MKKWFENEKMKLIVEIDDSLENSKYIDEEVV